MPTGGRSIIPQCNARIALERIRIGKATSIGIVTGAGAGLATITPASGYVGPGGAMAIGAVVCFFATLPIKHRFKVDDSLDVFAVHGVGRMLGSILLAGFALPALGGIGLTGLWSGVATWVIVQTLRMTTGLRVTREEEYDGLDLSVHGERAYDFN